MNRLFLSFFCAILLIISTFSSHAGQRENMRGERYCEILLSKTFTSYKVYNTVGLNNCPENLWKKINVTAVKKETGATYVHLNGPRYWVIDGFKNSRLINSTKKTICGIEMREAGILEIHLIDLLKSEPYQKHTVARQTTWVYDIEKPVYELIDPQGTAYVMQSYSIEKQYQTYDSLAELGSKLILPKGWQFKTGKLKNRKCWRLSIKKLSLFKIII